LTYTAVGLDYKQRFLGALDLSPGHAVVDIGCGPGTDFGQLADAVGETGAVIGVDREPRMLAEAGRRFGERSHVELRAGDVHSLRSLMPVWTGPERIASFSTSTIPRCDHAGPAEQILGLRRNSARAVEAGVFAEADAAGWLQRLRTGPFLAGFTFYLVTAQVWT
jgi:SAM-dependent methyltransferase